MDDELKTICCFFIKQKALFGAYPTQNIVDKLETLGVEYFINLTFPNERKVIPYTTTKEIIHFPIPDNGVPTDKTSYIKFIYRIMNILASLKVEFGQKIYIHCKGGHGRSGLVVATLLCVLKEIGVKEAIVLTTDFHNQRLNLKDIWKQMGSPQTQAQKFFIQELFGIYCIKEDYILCNLLKKSESTIKLEIQTNPAVRDRLLTTCFKILITPRHDLSIFLMKERRRLFEC